MSCRTLTVQKNHLTIARVVTIMITSVVIELKQISSRFTIAVHILTFITSVKEECTGDFIAASVNANPVIIRKIMSMLKKAELVDVRPGVGGAFLKKDAGQITLLNVYHAVDIIEDDQLFHFHNPVIECPVGRVIDTSLRAELKEAQAAMEHRLSQVTIQQLLINPK